MGPGRLRRPYASEQPQSSQGGSSSTTNRKRVRGRAKNKYLTKHIKRGGGKPRIEILYGKTRPIGNWSQEWINELGMISKYYIPPFAHKWKDVDDDTITLLHENVLNVSGKKKYSCSCLTTSHCGGSKSFIRTLADMADPESQQEPSQIELYKNTHYNEKKGWISLQAEENYVSNMYYEMPDHYLSKEFMLWSRVCEISEGIFNAPRTTEAVILEKIHIPDKAKFHN
ncbi:hypothetical protein IFM89_007619 [Coptis chinensis]|uniref:Uncharacterized protein n=1 Tax=Coptis chinensis TaxID=261450 RepID=A0A835LAH4_9MAGN|nr:hypothetical protein IFM89_007619 [Coptis chinensis]